MDAVTALDFAGEGTTEAQWHAWSGLERLPWMSLGALVPIDARVVVVAPHPDDEVLAVGGLVALLGRRGHAISLVAVTDGCASHEGSTQWSPERLQHARPMESADALQRLGVDVQTVRLGLQDGGVTRQRNLLVDRLLPLLGTQDVVFTTWRRDGHPDHDATGECCAIVAGSTGAMLVEVPVWAWHWARPADPRLPWHRARRIALDADASARKRCAVQAFESQLQADVSTGAGPILRASTVERASRPYEVIFV